MRIRDQDDAIAVIEETECNSLHIIAPRCHCSVSVLRFKIISKGMNNEARRSETAKDVTKTSPPELFFFFPVNEKRNFLKLVLSIKFDFHLEIYVYQIRDKETIFNFQMIHLRTCIT